MTAPPILPGDALRRAPPRAALATMAQAIRPGSTVSTIRRLRGGISSGMHAVQLRGPGAERLWVVVRRYGRWRLEQDPHAAEKEWATLQALAEVGAPTPRPIWLDTSGEVFGAPTITISRMPGRGLLAPRDLNDWVRQLAVALATIHATPLHGEALHLLDDQHAEISNDLAPVEPPQKIAKHPLGPDLWAAARSWWPRVEPVEPALVHGDYWPGNTLWQRGRLTAVIDWEAPRRGDPGQDVACCRLDLTLLHGPEAAATFLRAYQAATGQTPRWLFFWELVVATWATDDVEEWVKGYHDLGGTHVRPEEARARVQRFAAEALATADRHAASEG